MLVYYVIVWDREVDDNPLETRSYIGCNSYHFEDNYDEALAFIKSLDSNRFSAWLKSYDSVLRNR